MKLSLVLQHSIHWQSNSWKFLQKTKDFRSLVTLRWDIKNFINFSTRKKKLQSSLQRTCLNPNKMKCSQPWKLTQATKEKNSSSSSPSTQPSKVVFKCTPRPNSWTWVSLLVLKNWSQRSTNSLSDRGNISIPRMLPLDMILIIYLNNRSC